MSNVISSVKLTDKLSLTECKDGFWLWDETRGMNLSMKAKTSTDAFVEALGYYQERLLKVEEEHRALTNKVHDFVSQFKDED